MMNLVSKAVKQGLVLILFPMVIYAQKNQAKIDPTLQKIVEEVRQEFAPDKRSALFELKESDLSSGKYRIETTDIKAKEKFLSEIEKNNISTEFVIQVLPDQSVGETKKAVVRLSVVDIRYTPANQSEMVTQTLLGTPVDLLKKEGDYFLIRTPEGYIAWLKGASLTPMNAAAYQKWHEGSKLMFTDDFGHAYTEANRQSQRVSDLVMGSILLLDGEENDFYKVSYPDGRHAYISKDQSQPYSDWLANTSLTAENVLKIAKSMIGVPYLWGGTSIKGVDCSGFTKTSYFMNGVVIPRDASQQVNSGLEIDILTQDDIDPEKVLKNLQPADLLFFAERKGKIDNPRVTHVAIYMGDGEFIHASGLVRINSLFKDAENFDAHQARTIVGARRYIGQVGTQGLVPMQQHVEYAN